MVLLTAAGFMIGKDIDPGGGQLLRDRRHARLPRRLPDRWRARPLPRAGGRRRRAAGRQPAVAAGARRSRRRWRRGDVRPHHRGPARAHRAPGRDRHLPRRPARLADHVPRLPGRGPQERGALRDGRAVDAPARARPGLRRHRRLHRRLVRGDGRPAPAAVALRVVPRRPARSLLRPRRAPGHGRRRRRTLAACQARPRDPRVPEAGVAVAGVRGRRRGAGGRRGRRQAHRARPPAPSAPADERREPRQGRGAAGRARDHPAPSRRRPHPRCARGRDVAGRAHAFRVATRARASGSWRTVRWSSSTAAST